MRSFKSIITSFSWLQRKSLEGSTFKETEKSANKNFLKLICLCFYAINFIESQQVEKRLIIKRKKYFK